MKSTLLEPTRLHDAEHDRHPERIWRLLRDEHPVYHDTVDRVHVLSRHADVRAALMDPERFSARLYRKTMGRVFGPTLLQYDGHPHVQRRKLVAPVMVGSRLESYRPLVEAVAAEIVDAAVADGPFDLVERISHLLPGTVIAALLGLPREDYGQFFAWYEAMMSGLWVDDEARRRGRQAADELDAYVQPLVTTRRRDPGDDLISRLVHSEVDGDRLDDEDLGAYIALLLTAGGETTDKSIASLWWLLLTHRDVLGSAAGDESVLDAAFTETMRLLPPIVYVARETVTDVEMHGVTIPAGSEVRLSLGSANRDDRVFADSDSFIVDRPDLRERAHRSAVIEDGRATHLAFGAGPHFCIGYQLARMETVTVSRLLLDRLGTGIRLAGDTAPLVDGPTRSVPTLPVEW